MYDNQPLMAPDDHFPVHFNLNELVYTKWQLALNSCPFYVAFYDFLYKKNPCDFLYGWHMSDSGDNSSWGKQTESLVKKYPNGFYKGRGSE